MDEHRDMAAVRALLEQIRDQQRLLATLVEVGFDDLNHRLDAFYGMIGDLQSRIADHDDRLEETSRRLCAIDGSDPQNQP